MKRVSFEVAKIIKEAGYPQDYKNAEDTYTNLNGGIWVKPTYLEVWLWLWRERHNFLECVYKEGRFFNYRTSYSYADPEETIIASIEYLVDNNLIK